MGTASRTALKMNKLQAELRMSNLLTRIAVARETDRREPTQVRI
jgi:hypothetical protein